MALMFSLRRIVPLLLGLSAVALIVAACGDNDAPADDARTAADFAGEELVVLVHDSFAISAETIAAFEDQFDVTVTVVLTGDALEGLNRAILTKGNPEGDLLFGVDNISFVRALEADVFLPYRPAALDSIDESLIFDDSGHITPVNFGYVLFNFHKAALAQAGLSAPATLEQLALPDWSGRVAVQDPNTSSPGLQLMLVTIAYFGENGPYTWLDFWRDMRANDLIVSDNWTDAYYTQFSQYGGGAWLVNSYATSPPAEVIFAESPLDESPTGNVIVPGGSYRQVEGVGILRGTDKQPLAQAFIDFMLSDRFQSDIPLNMFVYPVVNGVPLPSEFLEFAQIPTEPAQIDADVVAANLERWLDEWTDVVLR
ncbi:MAG: thiamine transport system substrate-binding protein [Chloroflexi bacterium]|nr:MAG: thiamine transport system substrate-binding protein [Chloroflexota bacterium]